MPEYHAAAEPQRRAAAGHGPTLADVAREAEVHKATASRALNPLTRAQVSAETARRILGVAERIGYVPNTLARGLRTSRTAAIGVLIPDLTNPFFPPMVRGIEDHLAAAGYATLLANTDSDETRERSQFLALQSRRADGFIIATARRRHDLLTRAAARGVPLVLTNRVVDGLAVPAVVGDDAVGVIQAVEHLAALGHRQIGHLAGPQELSTGLTRLIAFRQAMAGVNLPTAPGGIVVCGAYTEESGRHAADVMLTQEPGITAILAGNDLIALGALTALAQRGRSCPGDVSVVGFNDMPYADKMLPPITTVHVPLYEMGAQAARLLLERLHDPRGVPKKILLPARLTVRGSTGPRPRTAQDRR